MCGIQFWFNSDKNSSMFLIGRLCVDKILRFQWKTERGFFSSFLGPAFYSIYHGIVKNKYIYQG